MLKKIYQKFFTLIHRDRSRNAWGSFEYFDSRWKKRIKLMCTLIEDERSFLDLGCGRMWLKNYLPEDCTYYGCDYTSRDENTIVCDFNNKEFPSLTVDCCFASGVIEYLDDYSYFFNQIKTVSKSFIFSYCPLEIQPDIKFRKSLGWRSHESRFSLLQTLSSLNFRKTTEQINVDGYDIYKFTL